MFDSQSPTPFANAKACATSATSAIRESANSGQHGAPNAVFSALAGAGLSWLPVPGIGFLPLSGSPYDAAYFEKYAGYALTPLGVRLNAARLDMVARHWRGHATDVGIGCGQFVASRPHTTGFDINPAGVAWLEAAGRFRDPRAGAVDALTFWDSLEHIPDPAPLLANARAWVFVSIPIFRNLPHVLRSKHFRPDEHCWYFTDAGFVAFMAAHGWRLVERNDAESRLGREDIASYAFARR